MNKYKIYCLWLMFFFFILVSCIENDIPYPYIPAEITAMEVEGQTGEPVINASLRTVSFQVNDTVYIDSLLINKLAFTEEAKLFPDSSSCIQFVKFPNMGFSSLKELPVSANTRMNFRKPVPFLLKTYQDYKWIVTVKQIINRTVAVSNQIGEAVVDEANKTVLIYVTQQQPLSSIQITDLNLGGSRSTITPEPSTVTNFERGPRKFTVCRLGKYIEEWIVDVVQTDITATVGQTEVWAKKAILTGGMPSGETPVVEYKSISETNWTVLPAASVTLTTATTFKAEISGLENGTAYNWRIVINGTPVNEATFTTEKIEIIPNLSFDDWSKGGKNWYPNPDASNSYWASGNEGVTLPLAGGFSPNTSPSDDAVKGKAARLLTLGKVPLVGVAAGNLYVGKYETNISSPASSVTFGRPFTGARPSGLKGWYKYKSMPVDNGSTPANLKNDECHIYLKLWDVNERQIAYGEFVGKTTTSEYKEFKFDVVYSDKTAKPAKITIVATSSRYGGDFSGVQVVGAVGSGSELLVDEFELIYD